MKYLVMKRDRSINFVVFNGPGYQLNVSSEKCCVPFYVRQYQNYQMGTFSVNENTNYCDGSVFTITNSGCNITVDGELLPQGISVMEHGRTYALENLTMMLIDEDERSEIESDFDIQNQYDEETWDPPPSPTVGDVDDGYSECVIYGTDNWDDDEDLVNS